RKIHDFQRQMPKLPADCRRVEAALLGTANCDGRKNMMPQSRRFVERLVASSLIAASAVGCSNMNNKQKGAVVGGAGGTVVGAVVGKQLGNTGAGAAVGALTGMAAGAL